MISRGGGGTPGLEHSAGSVLSLAATAGLLALVSLVLAIYGRRSVGPPSDSAPSPVVVSPVTAATRPVPEVPAAVLDETTERLIESTAVHPVRRPPPATGEWVRQAWKQNSHFIMAFGALPLFLYETREPVGLLLAGIFGLAFVPRSTNFAIYHRVGCVALALFWGLTINPDEGVVGTGPVVQALLVVLFLYWVAWALFAGWHGFMKMLDTEYERRSGQPR